jgi:hypothetical protein
MSASCPVHAEQQTFIRLFGTVAKGQQRTFRDIRVKSHNDSVSSMSATAKVTEPYGATVAWQTGGAGFAESAASTVTLFP